ncbi:hypothetical protein BW685_16740 [Burkholderia ubonensis]|uniref:Uncharacterized protein n=1 Tax=Burkholderia ubonensis TaxID=101571 RepID=A0A1R1JAC0_9BURK|nr:hypothetical protein BW685_16740 [Burkholderia ubonensis]
MNLFHEPPCAWRETCLESRLFRANGNAARKGKQDEPRSRNDVVKKVVDELRNSVHNLASLLLTTQRC